MSFKLILLQFNPAQASVTAQQFAKRGCTVAAVCHDGRELLGAVRQHQPDAVVMDAFMPGLNCDDMAAILTDEYHQTLVMLALADCRNDLLAARFMNNGGHYFIVSPPDYDRCIKQTRELLALYERRRANRADPILNCVQKYQLFMGTSANLVGFLYVQDAVKCVIENPAYLRRLTGGLYPTVGLAYQATGLAVERGIRLAIDSTFEKGDPKLLEQYFGAYIRKDSGKTTAGDFIFVLARMVCHELGIKM